MNDSENTSWEAPGISEQFDLLQSDVDVATWSLERLGLPGDWRDTNLPGNTERCQDAVDRIFTLTRSDIDAELARRGMVAEQLGHVRLEPGSRDGHYFVARGNLWETYFQEREGRWAEAVFDDLEEARKFLINLWLPVWLNRLQVPCRSRGGKVIRQL